MNNPKHLKLVPRVSEKVFEQVEKLHSYVFEVPTATNKHDIKKAVEAQFNVTVTGVNTVIAKGKTKRTIKKRTRPVIGRRKNIKKAYVVLKQGDRIDLFEESK